jgi:hypothetical protein
MLGKIGIFRESSVIESDMTQSTFVIISTFRYRRRSGDFSALSSPAGRLMPEITRKLTKEKSILAIDLEILPLAVQFSHRPTPEIQSLIASKGNLKTHGGFTRLRDFPVGNFAS